MKTTLSTTYRNSLLLAALLFATAVATSVITETYVVDFIYGNPNRTHSDSIEAIFYGAPFMGLTAFISALIVFTPPILFQKLGSIAFARLPHVSNMAWVFAMLPITGLITWYAFDYLTPSNIVLGINAGEGWKEYTHGLTIPRYLLALKAQAAMSSFVLIKQHMEANQSLHRKTMLAIFFLTEIGGIAHGYATALDQRQYLS